MHNHRVGVRHYTGDGVPGDFAIAPVVTRLAYVDLLAVDNRRQGKGYGRVALRAMLRLMKELGAEHVHLECLSDNDVGNRLYESEGFEEAARSIHWFLKIP